MSSLSTINPMERFSERVEVFFVSLVKKKGRTVRFPIIIELNMIKNQLILFLAILLVDVGSNDEARGSEVILDVEI